MKSVEIFTRKLSISNREGNTEVISFPVLSVSLDKENCQKLNSCLNSRFSIRINSYCYEKYNHEEKGFTLYCDHPLSIFLDSDGNLILASD